MNKKDTALLASNAAARSPSALKGGSMKVEFFRHAAGEAELQRIAAVLQTPFLTTGEVVKEFERDFSRYLGCANTVGVTSCTAALHLSLLAYDIGEGDEVITTPLTFVATTNAIIHAGAVPVMVDVEASTGNLDASLVEAAITPATKAIMPVHLYGQMCDMRALRNIADRHGLIIIEDCAHCIEGVRDGVRPGQLSEAACFSFYATKNITCAEGGAVSTNRPEIAERLRRLRLHGMSKGAEERYSQTYEHWDVTEVGWKYNMDNIQAAFLLAQLPRIDAWLARRHAIASRYEQAFRGLDGIQLLETVPGSRSATHLFTILVDGARRDELLKQLQLNQIGVAVNYRPVHLLTWYQRHFGFARGTFPVAESIGDRTITLPLYPLLRDEEVDYVIETVSNAVRSLNAV